MGLDKRVIFRLASSWDWNPTGKHFQSTVLLFLVFVNDLLDDGQSNSNLFVDNGKIYQRIENQTDRGIQEDIKSEKGVTNGFQIQMKTNIKLYSEGGKMKDINTK